MKLIPVGAQLFAMVDDWSFDWLSQYNWQPKKEEDGRVYARRRVLHDGSLVGDISMHRTILLVHCPMAELMVDHADRNTLNNQVSNLRWATARQNASNQVRREGLKGFSFCKAKNAYRASIGFDGKKIKLGTSADPNLVAKMYDQAARMLFGPFARLNFPELNEDVLGDLAVERVLKTKRESPDVTHGKFHRYVENILE